MPVLKECRGNLGEDWGRAGGRDHRGGSGTAPAWGTAGSRSIQEGLGGIHQCSHKPVPSSDGTLQLPLSHFELKIKRSSLLFSYFSIIFRVLPLESSMTM